MLKKEREAKKHREQWGKKYSFMGMFINENHDVVHEVYNSKKKFEAARDMSIIYSVTFLKHHVFPRHFTDGTQCGQSEQHMVDKIKRFQKNNEKKLMASYLCRMVEKWQEVLYNQERYLCECIVYKFFLEKCSGNRYLSEHIMSFVVAD